MEIYPVQEEGSNTDTKQTYDHENFLSKNLPFKEQYGDRYK